jgi:hypothetical protein
MDLDPRDDLRLLLVPQSVSKHYAADGRKLVDLERVGAMTPDTDPDDRAQASPIVQVTPPR